MPRKKNKRRKRKPGDLALLYAAIFAASCLFSCCVSCSFSFILNQIGIISPLENDTHALFSFCISPLILAIIVSAVASLIAIPLYIKNPESFSWLIGHVESATDFVVKGVKEEAREWGFGDWKEERDKEAGESKSLEEKDD